MPDFSVEAPACATKPEDSPTAGLVAVATDITPSAEQLRNPLMPRHREVFEDGESIGQQALARAREMAVAWWSLLENLRESDAYGESRKGTLPAWARELIGSYVQQHEAYDENRQWHEAANRALMLAEGEQVSVFEVWTKRGHRLDGQHEFWTQADASRQKLAARFPDAFVCRVHPQDPLPSGSGAELLDTLIGRTYWCGVSFGEPGAHNFHTVQDSTGRTVTVPSDVLLAHAAFERMTADGQSCVQSHAGKVGAA